MKFMLKASAIFVALALLPAVAVLFLDTFYPKEDCYGWSCDIVKCPDGYAVMIPGKGLLMCEDFDAYIKTGSNEYLR